jgi:hypothetical protein
MRNLLVVFWDILLAEVFACAQQSLMKIITYNDSVAQPLIDNTHTSVQLDKMQLACLFTFTGMLASAAEAASPVPCFEKHASCPSKPHSFARITLATSQKNPKIFFGDSVDVRKQL